MAFRPLPNTRRSLSHALSPGPTSQTVKCERASPPPRRARSQQTPPRHLRLSWPRWTRLDDPDCGPALGLDLRMRRLSVSDLGVRNRHEPPKLASTFELKVLTSRSSDARDGSQAVP